MCILPWRWDPTMDKRIPYLAYLGYWLTAYGCRLTYLIFVSNLFNRVKIDFQRDVKGTPR